MIFKLMRRQFDISGARTCPERSRSGPRPQLLILGVAELRLCGELLGGKTKLASGVRVQRGVSRQKKFKPKESTKK
jgi:hypothetical protein